MITRQSRVTYTEVPFAHLISGLLTINCRYMRLVDTAYYSMLIHLMFCAKCSINVHALDRKWHSTLHLLCRDYRKHVVSTSVSYIRKAYLVRVVAGFALDTAISPELWLSCDHFLIDGDTSLLEAFQKAWTAMLFAVNDSCLFSLL